jgi:uncharacterized protein with NAD-binding domain and iron-sulfur cluster
MGRTKIAVIGGGVGAITTVYAMTRDPSWQERYEITVYQLGWRLGGKGASGRDLARGARIQEHGLHVWAGFYDNAFRSIRGCYDDLVSLGLRRPTDPLGTWDTAFKPLRHLFLSERIEQGGEPRVWKPWLIDLPANDLEPGTATSAPSPFEMFLQMAADFASFLENGPLAERAKAHLGPADAARLSGAHAAIRGHLQTMPRDPRQHDGEQTSLLADLIGAAQEVVHSLETPANLADDDARRLLYLMDISLASMRGLVASDTFTAGYDVLDQWEFSDWLRRSGASALALDSVILRGCYDFVFGFPLGKSIVGDAGAGTSIRAMSRLLFTYRGAIFWEMQAGMGDTIFAPYYQVLAKIGVRFRFFNAARKLVLDADRTRVAAIDMVEQAAVKNGDYSPLVDVKGLPCWPSEPLWDQLVGGDSGIDFECEKSPPSGRAYTLAAGTDFDQVVLGASLGSLPYLTEELTLASPRWRDMLTTLESVGTHAAQFWLCENQDSLGWRELVERSNPPSAIPAGPLRTIITGFAEPLDTWADMSHLLPVEDWKGQGPTSIAYYCAAAPEGETTGEFRAATATWTNDDIVRLWPRAKRAGGDGFDDALFYREPERDGSRFDDQYFRVNMYGSERYVLSVTGSVFKRLAADESGFENLFLAGDWTRCGLNAGCVEAATISGIAAASAVTGRELLNVGADDIASDSTTLGQAMYETSSVTAAHWPLSGFYARGEMNGWFLFYAMPRAEVQALLPDGMFLAHSTLVPPDLHPVGVSLTQYHDVRGSFVPDFLRMSPYGEATFAIPFVHAREGGRARYLYPRRLYVNNWAAVLAGWVCYSMNKVHAAVATDDRSFRVLDPTGRPFLEAEIEQRDEATAMRDHDAFGTIAEILNLPFITQARSGRRFFNAFNMELSRAYVAPVAAELSVKDSSEGGFPPCTRSFAPLRSGHAARLPGAFRVWCSWSMTNPLDSWRVRESARAESWLRRTY